MKIFARFFIRLFIIGFMSVPDLFAGVPSTITYQGTLTNNVGQPVAGSKNVTFRLYNTAAGGKPFWIEIQTVTTHEGKFSVVLGKTKPLNLAKFTGETYISLQVEPDTEEMPRQQFHSVAYALRSADAAVPKNTIVTWYGDPVKVPSGWALCDGKNGTPDLRGRFVVGAGIEGTEGNQYKYGDIGGINANDISHTHSIAADSPGTSAAGDHQHPFSGNTNTTTNDNHTVDDQDSSHQRDMSGAAHYHSFSGTTAGAGGHSHTVNAHSHGGATGVGGSATLENRPPYYALVYIMKL